MNVQGKGNLDCTSCQLCAVVCNKNAIRIKLDEEGFYRPYINNDICNNCGCCVSVCYKYDSDIKVSSEAELDNKKLFAAWAKDEQIVKKTTSGGCGDLLAHSFLKDGYNVVGVVYDKDRFAVHIVTSEKNALNSFRGSKYIQSYTYDAFRKIVENCKNEKFAVFGTPCQIYALNKFVEKRKVRENFIFVDLYCHGCPSLFLWKKYLSELEVKYGANKIDGISFRSKIKGWGSFHIGAIVDGKERMLGRLVNDPFYEIFFSDQILNPACHNCKLRSSLEYTDIRLGDFWGKEFLNNTKGVSAVSLSTEQGRYYFDKIKDAIIYKEFKFSYFLPYQSWGKEYHPNLLLRSKLMQCMASPEQSIDDLICIYRKNQSLGDTIMRWFRGFFSFWPLGITNRVKWLLYTIK